MKIFYAATFFLIILMGWGVYLAETYQPPAEVVEEDPISAPMPPQLPLASGTAAVLAENSASSTDLRSGLATSAMNSVSPMIPASIKTAPPTPKATPKKVVPATPKSTPATPAPVAAPIADTKSPSTPTDLVMQSATPDQINLTWGGSSDENGIAGYRVYRDGKNIVTTMDTYYADVDAPLSLKFSYYVVARDDAGNMSAPSNTIEVSRSADGQSYTSSSTAPATPPATPPPAATATGATADTVAPSIPSGVTATAISSTQITLTWNASTDNVAVSGYKIFRNGTALSTISGVSYTNTGLTPSTAYTYTVLAYDAAGNNSAQSGSANATTPAGSASAPPAPASCAGTTMSSCVLSATASGGTSGSCTSGYTGSCDYTCTDGVWTKSTNSCAAPPPTLSPCSATTISNCALAASASGASSGSCSGGYTGSCNYTCTDGTWTASANSCVAPPPPPAACGSGGPCTAADIALHNTTSNCWVYVNTATVKKAYNVTAYIASGNHPISLAGPIAQYCGGNFSAFYTGSLQGHNHSTSAKNLLNTFYVGVFQ